RNRRSREVDHPETLIPTSRLTPAARQVKCAGSINGKFVCASALGAGMKLSTRQYRGECSTAQRKRRTLTQRQRWCISRLQSSERFESRRGSHESNRADECHEERVDGLRVVDPDATDDAGVMRQQDVGAVAIVVRNELLGVRGHS